MSDTPITNARWETFCCSGQSWYQIAEEMKLDCRQLERELNAVTEQRDRLAEALKELRNNESMSLGGAAYEIVEQAIQSLTTNVKVSAPARKEGL